MSSVRLSEWYVLTQDAFLFLRFAVERGMFQADLSLEILTNHYLYLLSPFVFSKKKKRNIPLYEAYADLMELLNIDDERMQEYKKQILGNSCIETAPSEYYDISMALEYRIPYHIWIDPLQFPVDAKAKLRATVWLKGMAEVIDAHNREHDRKQKDTMTSGKV